MNQQQAPNPAQTYEEFLVPGLHARWTQVLLDHAGPRPGERVLDLACGTGIVTRHVAPLVGTEGHVLGLDVSPDMLEVARALPAPPGASAEWREGNAASLPLPDADVDLVLCQQGLQFFADRAAAVREMRRVLAPGGHAAVSVFRGLDHHPLYEALIGAEARYLNVPTESVAAPFSLGDADELRALFDDAGFERVTVAPESLAVRFPSPDRFVALTLLAAASIIPDAEMDAAARSDLVETVSQQASDVLATYVEGDAITFPTYAHVAIAYA